MLSGPPGLASKYSINHIFDLHVPIDNMQLSKTDIKNIFLPATEKKHKNYYKKLPILDPVIKQLKSWHKHKKTVISHF